MKNILYKIFIIYILGLLTPATAGVNTAQLAQTDTKIYPIKGNLPDLKFQLNSADKTYSEKDFEGYVTLITFGYASCPDICPTTLAELNILLKSLTPDQANRTRVIFISVDPYRDTPELLKNYVSVFSDKILGLTSDENTISKIAKRYRVAYQIEKPKNNDPHAYYEVMHARGIYIFDQHGEARFLATNAIETEKLRDSVVKLIDKN
ncbi:SCO family protein [Taylorella equigenitalis]|nr:SCO family protein [Taylorella equigenitalis]WEE01121.1 SCO family protein [Taylorella equigenitalis]WEE02599.1 SCO family protein [Taylorella equigenitalis]WFD80612.1 SCO family protein [Taylorella equigenitalis]WFD82091.1 SCO family protein [Taylorella equigenitalis]WFD83570.1 SCO family protein [Taylorella equigenitalis]